MVTAVHNPMWTRTENATNAAAMATRSHFDKLVEEQQAAIIKALLISARQGEMARSAFLSGKHEAYGEAVELYRKAIRAGADPDGGDDL